MKIRNLASVASVSALMAWLAGGCLDLQTSPGTTKGTGGAAGMGQGGAGADSGGNGSGGQAGGPAGPCTPGMMMNCYPGPPETQSKGVCQAGQIVCDPNGMWGDCNGLILPGIENCTATQDLNCDGRMGCEGIPRSSVELSTAKDDAVAAIAIGKGTYGWDGPVYGGGYRNALLDSAATPSMAQVLLVKRDPSGTLTDLSNRFFIDTFGHAWARDVAVDANENLYVVGTYQGASLNVAGQGLKTPGTATLGFLASFDPAGNLRFVKDFGATGTTEVKRVRVDAAGDVYISGRFDTSIDFGNNLVMSNGGFDGFVASYSSAGALRWRKTWSGTGDESVDAISVGPDGALYAAAIFTASITVSGGPVFMTEGGFDTLVSKHLSTDGATQWHNQLGGNGDVVVTDIDMRIDRVAVLSAFRGSLAIGGSNYVSNDGPYSWDIVVGTLETAGGAVMTSLPFLADGIQVGTSISTDPFGEFVVGGYFMQTLPLGGAIADLTTGGDVNAFALKLDQNLGIRWAHGYGNSLTQAFLDVAVDLNTGNTFVSGGLQGILLGFGVMEPQSNGGFDAMIGRMSN